MYPLTDRADPSAGGSETHKFGTKSMNQHMVEGGAGGAVKDLAGRVALVTGSSSGIGLGIARAYAAAGAKVVFNGIEAAADGTAIAAEVAARTGAATAYHRADLSAAAGVHDLVQAARAQFGRIDILVNNAGMQHVAPIEDFPDRKWDQILALNLSAAFHAAKAVFPAMRERGFGRIVNIASAHGLVASPFKSAYVASKHGLIGLTRTLALEGGKDGITANAICPGYVLTPLVERQVADQAKAHGIPADEVADQVFLSHHPTGKFVTIDQVAALALLLAGPEGGSINGAALSVDGGWTAR